MCRQPPCASSGSLTWPEIVSRSRQLRSARLLCLGVVSLSQLSGTVAKELTDSIFTVWFAHRGGLLGVDLLLVWSMFNACFNMKT